MAVRIETGGRVLMFLAGAALVVCGLGWYGLIDLSRFGLPRPAPGTRPAEAPGPAAPAGAAAARTNHVRVRLHTRAGCAAGLVANGGLETEQGSAFDKNGLKVSFKVGDDWTEGAPALDGGETDVLLTTADAWAKDRSQLLDKGSNGRAFFLVDWSRGADGIVGGNEVNRMEDLAGRVVSFAPYSPSHFLLWNGLRSSGLSAAQQDAVFMRALRTKDGTETAAVFGQRKADAAVSWDPYLSSAAAKRVAANKIYDTRTANKLIADVLVVSDRFAAGNPDTVAKLVEGWLEGVAAVRAQPSRGYNLIGSIREFHVPADHAKAALEGVRLADYADNVAFFGSGPDSDYGKIFRMAEEMYRDQRVINRTSDVEGSLDRRYLESLRSKYSSALTRGPARFPTDARPATMREDVPVSPGHVRPAAA